MHFSGEVTPDPNPRVLDNDVDDVRAAVADGLEVYAFEGATHWLTAQGLRFEKTSIALQPFEAWLAAQPRGTVIAAASAGRPLPIEWLPAGSWASGRANYGAFVWIAGDSSATVAQQHTQARVDHAIGSDARTLTVESSDDGPQIIWGDSVLTAIDRGLAVAAFTPAGNVIGRWGFTVDETPGVQLPPSPYVQRGASPCEVLRPGERTSVAEVLADGGWWATSEGNGSGAIVLDTDQPPSAWRHHVANGRGDASIDAERSRVVLESVPGTRSVFRLSMPPSAKAPFAMLDSNGITAVRVCRATVPALPPTGALEVGPDQDGWFGAGWHLGERGGTERFRWSRRSSTLVWRMDNVERIRMILRMRAANAKGATLTAAINGTMLPSCALPAGSWTDCRFELPETSIRSGINELSLTADTMSPSADRPGDARELAFEMQASRVRVGG